MHPRGWFDYTPDGWVNPTADKDSLSVVMALPFQRGFHITPTKYFTLSFIHVTRRFLKAFLSGCLPRSLPKLLSLCRRSRCRSLDGSLCRGPLPRPRRGPLPKPRRGPCPCRGLDGGLCPGPCGGLCRGPCRSLHRRVHGSLF
jgi:hypothetical protein